MDFSFSTLTLNLNLAPTLRSNLAPTLRVIAFRLKLNNLYVLPRGAWEREFKIDPCSRTKVPCSHALRGSKNSNQTINKQYAFPRGAWERANNKLRKRKVSQIYISNNLNLKESL